MRKRKKYLSFLLCGAITISGMTAWFPAKVQADEGTGKAYYVAKDGSDSNDGSLASPYQTIGKAMEMMQPGDTLYVREGIYHEEIKPQKSGAAGAPITITNYNEEEVILSGCKQITGWTKDEEKEGVYKAPMGWSLGDYNGNKNQVFAGGELMFEARYPNLQEGDTLMSFTRAKMDSGSGTKGVDRAESVLVDSDLKTFAEEADFFDEATIWMVPGAGWTSETHEVKTYDPGTGTLTFDSSTRAKDAKKTGNYKPKAGNDYYIYGSYNLLDAEKEWWYDDDAQELYLKTPDGKNPDESGLYVEAKEYENVLDLSDCSYINVEGIDIRGGAVITDEDSSNILLKDMHCEYVGHDSRLVIEDVNDNACDQDDLGILLKGTNIEVNSCEIAYSSGPLINVQGSDNKVINCYIHEGDYIGSYCGHTKLSGRRQFISNNTMTDSGRDTVSFRDLAESVVQYNDISGSARLTKDVGIMYSAETDGQNTLIHHNFIHDSYNPNTTNDNGLYPDEMTHNFIMFNNVIWNVKSNAMCLNQPSLYNLVYNNTGYNKNSVSDAYQSSHSDSRGRQLVNNYFSGKRDNTWDAKSTWYYNNSNPEAGFADADGGNFQIGADSALAGAGAPLSGIATTSIGAYDPGESFVVGHDFENPPTVMDPPAVEEFEYRNLIKNGGFEYGTLEGWSGSATVVDDTAWHTTTATAATCFYGLKMAPGQTIFQTVAVKPNTTYTLGLNTRSASGSKLQFGAVGLEAGDAVTTEESSGSSWSGSTRKFLEFTTGTEDTSVVISLTNAGENELLLDDVGLQKNVVTIGDLSQEVTLNYHEEQYEAEVLFDDLEAGHEYYYSDERTEQTTLKEGAFACAKPENYSQKLNNGDKLTLYPEEYLNVAEVCNGQVIGIHSYFIDGDASVIPTVDSIETLEPVEVFYGTEAEELKLPETVKVGVRSSGTLAEASVIWNTENYVPTETDTYHLTGTLVLPEGILNIKNITAEIDVTVKNRTLVEVTPADRITGIANGTALEQIALPETVNLVTDGGNVSAKVTWDLSQVKGYDPANKSRQTFQVPGVAELPTGVCQPEEAVNLVTAVTVTVEAGIDVSSLQALYEESKKIGNEGYTADSWEELKNSLLAAAEVLGSPVSQDAVDQAEIRLQMAVKGLCLEDAEESVDKSSLEKTYQANKALPDIGYTAESWQAYQNMLKLAEQILADENATQAQADYMAQLLLDTVAALEVQENADKVSLQRLYNEMMSVNREAYTEESFKLFETAMENALAVLENEMATPEQILSAENVLNRAFAELDKKPAADKTELKELCELCEAVKNEGYTAESWNRFRNMLKAAQAVLEDAYASQPEVNLAVKELREAKEALKKAAADKTSLKKTYQEMLAVQNQGYTAESWSNFQAMLSEAGRILNLDAATEEEVRTAEQNLINAYNGLIKEEGPGPEPAPGVDKNALDTLYAQYEGIADTGYTDESWAAFQGALANAKAVLDNPDATQEEVNAAAALLKEKAAGLTKPEEPGEEPGTEPGTEPGEEPGTQPDTDEAPAPGQGGNVPTGDDTPVGPAVFGVLAGLGIMAGAGAGLAGRRRRKAK